MCRVMARWALAFVVQEVLSGQEEQTPRVRLVMAVAAAVGGGIGQLLALRTAIDIALAVVDEAGFAQSARLWRRRPTIAGDALDAAVFQPLGNGGGNVARIQPYRGHSKTEAFALPVETGQIRDAVMHAGGRDVAVGDDAELAVHGPMIQIEKALRLALAHHIAGVRIGAADLGLDRTTAWQGGAIYRPTTSSTFRQSGILGHLEGAQAMGLKSMGLPNVLNSPQAYTDRLRDGAAGPMGAVPGASEQGSASTLATVASGRGGPTRLAGLVTQQPIKALLGTALLPAPHRWAANAAASCNVQNRHPLAGMKNDPCPPRMLLRQVPIADDRRKAGHSLRPKE
jgi:hypothetical protein